MEEKEKQKGVCPLITRSMLKSVHNEKRKTRRLMDSEEHQCEQPAMPPKFMVMSGLCRHQGPCVGPWTCSSRGLITKGQVDIPGLGCHQRCG